MDGTRNIVTEVKKSMGLQPTQGFTRGISSEDIYKFLRSLVKEYKDLGREIKYVWRKMEGSRGGDHIGFSGVHVQRITKRTAGNYILFGKGARNNAPRAALIKRVGKFKGQTRKYIEYGETAQGLKRADHAVSIHVGECGQMFYDNAFLNIAKPFCLETLMLYMEDICYCFVCDIFEV
jgi:hypothetical protein